MKGGATRRVGGNPQAATGSSHHASGIDEGQAHCLRGGTPATGRSEYKRQNTDGSGEPERTKPKSNPVDLTMCRFWNTAPHRRFLGQLIYQSSLEQPKHSPQPKIRIWGIVPTERESDHAGGLGRVLSPSQNGDAGSLTEVHGPSRTRRPIHQVDTWPVRHADTQVSICRRVAVCVLKLCEAQLVLRTSRNGTSIALMGRGCIRNTAGVSPNMGG
jgi:hypothetical protein